MNEVLVAIFDSEDAAVRAISALTGAGVSRNSIRRYRRDEYDAPAGMAGSGTTAAGARAETRPHESQGGFWSWLLGEESGTADWHSGYETDYELYRGAVDAGRVVLAVTVAQADAHRILNCWRCSRRCMLRTSGPTSAAANGAASAPEATPATPANRPKAGDRDKAGKTEEVIPLAEEHVDIGKRRVEFGGTRIRRYVTERPVKQQVNLRDEHVEIERRKPVAGGSRPGADAFEERTVEVREFHEEPVVERHADVGEEIVVRKEVREHPETVRTTERKDKVDVSRGGRR